MTLPKQQHWVPRFYLRFFATPETAGGDEPQVWLLSKDEGGPVLTNIKKVATQRYLYSQTAHRDNAVSIQTHAQFSPSASSCPLWHGRGVSAA